MRNFLFTTVSHVTVHIFTTRHTYDVIVDMWFSFNPIASRLFGFEISWEPLLMQFLGKVHISFNYSCNGIISITRGKATMLALSSQIDFFSGLNLLLMAQGSGLSAMIARQKLTLSAKSWLISILGSVSSLRYWWPSDVTGPQGPRLLPGGLGSPAKQCSVSIVHSVIKLYLTQSD